MDCLLKKGVNRYKVITLFHEVPNDNGQWQFFCFIVTICCNTLKSFFKSVSVRKNNLKFCTFTSTKNSHGIHKNQISVAETLKGKLLELKITCS